MAITNITGQAAPNATTETDLYTVPASSRVTVSSVLICNRGAAATFRVSHSVGGGATTSKDYWRYDQELAANGTEVLTIGATLNAGDKIRCYASTATVSFAVYGVKIT